MLLAQAKLQESMLQQITDVKSKLQQAELRSSLDVQPLADGWLWSSPDKKAAGVSSKRAVTQSTGGRLTDDRSTSRSPRKSPLRGRAAALGTSCSTVSWPDTVGGATRGSTRSPLRHGVASAGGAGTLAPGAMVAGDRGSLRRSLGSMLPKNHDSGRQCSGYVVSGIKTTGQLAAAIHRGLVDSRMPYATSAAAAIEAGELLQLRASLGWEGGEGHSSGGLQSSRSSPEKKGSSRRQQQQQYVPQRSIEKGVDLGDENWAQPAAAASAGSSQRSSKGLVSASSKHQKAREQSPQQQQQQDGWQWDGEGNSPKQQQGLGDRVTQAAPAGSSSNSTTQNGDVSFSGMVEHASPPIHAQAGPGGILSESILDPYSPSLLSAKKAVRAEEHSSSSAQFSRLGPLEYEGRGLQQQERGQGQQVGRGMGPAAAPASPSSYRAGGARPGTTDFSEPYSLPMSAECSQLSGISTAAAAVLMTDNWTNAPNYQQQQRPAQVSHGLVASASDAAGAGSGPGGGSGAAAAAAGGTGGNAVLASARETLQRIKAKRSQLSQKGGAGAGIGGSVTAGSLQTSSCTTARGAAAVARGSQAVPGAAAEGIPAAVNAAARASVQRSSSSNGTLSDESSENGGGKEDRASRARDFNSNQQQQQGLLGSAKLAARLQQLQQQKQQLQNGLPSGRCGAAGAGGGSSAQSPRPAAGISSPRNSVPAGDLKVAAAGPMLLSPPSTVKAQRSRPARQPDGPIPLVGLEEAGREQEQQQSRGQVGAAAVAERSRNRVEKVQRASVSLAGGLGTSLQDQLDMGMEQFISKLADGELTLEQLATFG